MAHVSIKKISAPGVLSVQRAAHKRASNDTEQTQFLPIALGVVLIIFLFSFIYLWSRVNVTKYGYEISSAVTARASLSEENRRLSMEITRLKSPERIERVAKDELGLVYPTADQIVRIK